MAAPSSRSSARVNPEIEPRSAESAAPAASAARRAEPLILPAEPLEKALFDEAFAFDFFQAVRVLEWLGRGRRPVGRGGPPQTEVVRFRALASLNFPPSAVYELTRPEQAPQLPVMTVAFLGLTGPSGVLPRHYTELLLRQTREAKGPEKFALRDWFDLFNHRIISLFYRAWEKYRFYVPYERGDYAGDEPDPFSQCLFSLVGLGAPPLRNRLRVSTWEVDDDAQPRERVLARVDDLALLHFSGYLAQRPRCALALEALLRDFFQVAVRVLQFQGQWLALDADNQSRLGGGNNELGVSVVAGERVWDVQSKFRVRLGPLRLAQFIELLPDRAPVPERKAFFLLTHLVRLYVGLEFDFDVQLVLRAADVPECQLTQDGSLGPRLGWNTWVRSLPFPHDADEAVFAGEETIRVGA